MLPKKGYQLECEKPLHRGGGQNGNFSVTYFLRDLLVASYNRNFFTIRANTSKMSRHVESTGPCVGVAAQGQEGATTNENQFKTLIKHWYSIMQSSNCSMFNETINQAPSIRTNLQAKKFLESQRMNVQQTAF